LFDLFMMSRLVALRISPKENTCCRHYGSWDNVFRLTWSEPGSEQSNWSSGDSDHLMLPTWPLLRPQKLTLSPATIASFGSAGAFNQAFGLVL
jgi:hypothetical protein